MSFNVFDESPENQIVIKEQQTQNKVGPFISFADDNCLSNIFCDTIKVGEQISGIYGVLEIGLRISIDTHSQAYPIVVKSCILIL